MFFAVQVPKLMFKKRLKHRNLQCFLFLPSRKQRYLQSFLTLRAPKSSQNIGIYDVLAKNKTASVATTPLFATLSQHNMSEMTYSIMFLDHLQNTCIKHRKYQQIKRLHFPWQQAETSKNTDTYSVSG